MTTPSDNSASGNDANQGLNTPRVKVIQDAKIILPDESIFEGTLVIEGQTIRDILDHTPGSLLLNEQNVELFSAEGNFITPGLMDLHFNGALGCNFNDCTIQDIQQLLQTLPLYGVTSIVSSTITNDLEDMIRAIHVQEEAIHHKHPFSTRLLGLHLEGPFINAEKRGSHPEASVRQASLDELKLLLSPNIKWVTLAPEMDPEGILISHLVEQGIRVSAGHSNATYAEMTQGIDRGISSITHVFNAMRSFHHRDPGIAGAAFTHNDLFVQIIGDGDHVHPPGVHMVSRGVRPESVILVSDAYPMAGLDEGAESEFGHQKVTLTNGRAQNEEGRLVGGHELLDNCVRNLLSWNVCSFERAIRYASANVSHFLGEEDRLGHIRQGYTADLVMWNKDTYAVEATWINGEQIYNKANYMNPSMA